MTDTDIWNWISAFIQSFAETFLLVNVYCAFLGQPRIKKYVAYSLISCFAIAYCVFINVFALPTYLRYSLSLCVFFAYSMAWNGPGWKRLFAVCTDIEKLTLNINVPVDVEPVRRSQDPWQDYAVLFCHQRLPRRGCL